MKKQKNQNIILTCLQCGKTFEVPPYREHTAKCCSNKCSGQYRSRNFIGGQHPLHKTKITKTCVQCGRLFEVHSYRQHTTKFCSVKCNGEWKSNNLCGIKNPLYLPRTTKVCEMCGTSFEIVPSLSSQRFCSPKCRGAWLSKTQRGENHPKYGKTPSDATRKLMRDNHANLFGSNSPHWRGGISYLPYCEKFNITFKESVREKHDRRCFLCGVTEAHNGRKLSVHHVNYDKNCLCDGVECEFMPLCMSCHALTTHHREYYEDMIMNMLEAKGGITSASIGDKRDIAFKIFSTGDV